MAEQFLQCVPILRIFDIAKAKEFYVGYLGFTVDWEHRFDDNAPLYMQVSRGCLMRHLSEHHGDCCPGSTVFVRMQGIEYFHREITAKEYRYLRPGIEMAPWKAKCMEVVDPSGNRIRFNEDTWIACHRARHRCDDRSIAQPVSKQEQKASKQIRITIELHSNRLPFPVTQLLGPHLP